MNIVRISMLWLVVALSAILAGTSAHAQTFPPLTGRVVDQADLLTPAQEAELTARLAMLESQSNRQLVIATIQSLEGYDIADYGYRLGRAWAIGNDGVRESEKDNGAILLIAPAERKVRIEVGYGLEPILTDALSDQIIRNDITPRFREGEFAGGISAATDSIVEQLTLPPEEARKVVDQAAQRAREDSGNDRTIIIIWLFILVFFIVIPMFFGRKGRRYRGGAGPIIIWSGNDWGGGSGGGGFGGGGFGGGGSSGGFSGGGGSFGGGGASGGW